MFFAFAVSLLLAASSFSDRIINTTSGECFLLKDDGTWEVASRDSTEGQDSEKHNFRRTKWGFTVDQVRASEESQAIHQTDDVLVYEDRVADKDFNVAYIFVSNKLVRAKYILKERHSNKADYLLDYATLKKVLKEKYGSPDEDESMWRNDLYKDDSDHWGMAVSVGHLILWSKWTLPETSVFLLINGENYDIDVVIEYSGLELASLEKQQSKQQNLDDF